MLANAGVCWRVLACADVSIVSTVNVAGDESDGVINTYADVCWRMLAYVCGRMLAYAVIR